MHVPVSEVHHVALIVSDLERSATFYEQGLGYRRTLAAPVGGETLERSLGLPAGTNGRIQYLQGPSQIGQLELIEWTEPPGPQPRTGHRELGAFLLSFAVPAEELDELHARLESLGAQMVERPITSTLDNYGDISAFAAYDPDGNLLEFVALPTREQILSFRKSQAAG